MTPPDAPRARASGRQRPSAECASILLCHSRHPRAADDGIGATASLLDEGATGGRGASQKIALEGEGGAAERHRRPSEGRAAFD